MEISAIRASISAKGNKIYIHRFDGDIDITQDIFRLIEIYYDYRVSLREVAKASRPLQNSVRCFEVRVYCCPWCGGDLSRPVEPLEPQLVEGREYIDELISGVELKRRSP